jgi:hypothetical protein
MPWTGARIKYKPVTGLYLKGVIGKQRFGFEDGFTKGPGIVRGFDAELQLSELCDSMAAKGRNRGHRRQFHQQVPG